MNPHALVIGDVDNDNENEFVIGNLNGDLAIFKGECADGFPSYVCRGLGTITCIAIGDVRNHRKNSVVVINAEGHAHIFDIPSKSKYNQDQHQHISADDYLRGGRRSSDTASIQAFRRMMSGNGPTISTPPLNEGHQGYSNHSTPKPSMPYIHDLGKPNLTLKVPVNVNKILIADIDNDGLNELILARTDRILHAFQLMPSDLSTPFDHMYKGIQTPSVASLSPSASTNSLNGLASQQPSVPPTAKRSVTTANIISSAKEELASSSSSKKTSLLDKNMWVFDGQISSLCTTTHPERPNEPLLLVAQPGNTFTIIDQDGKRYNRDFTPQQTATTVTSFSVPTVKANTEDESNIKSLLLNIEEKDILRDESAKADDGSINFKRSNYVVKNWPILDAGGGNNNDDVIDDEIESGAVATEIVIGKRHTLGDSYIGSEVGMLSMDGKFSIYDLRSKTTSERDLFVTHKLFSLATLDVSSTSASNAAITKKSTFEKHSMYNNTLHKYNTNGTQTPLSGTSHLRFSTTPRHGTSLNEGSRSSSKISLNGLANSFKKKVISSQSNSDEEEDEEDSDDVQNIVNEDDDIINRRAVDDVMTSDTNDISNTDDDEDDSDYESVPWSEGSEDEDEPGCDLFVACAWNGVTYLIDWSKKIGDDHEDSDDDISESDTEEEQQQQQNSKIKYQLVKFAFEGRVCAFTAGLYSVNNQLNVPCLFYVDFEDQIYVYYDVRISPGPVTGFIDAIDDDIEEALDRIIGIESGIDALSESNHIPKKKREYGNTHHHDADAIDLGDGWKGIADDDEDEDEDDNITPVTYEGELSNEQQEDADPLNLADFIHECLYGFADMKDRVENEMLAFEQNRLSNRLPTGGDVRRLSDLNITIEPPALDNEMTSDSASIGLMPHDNVDDEEEELERNTMYAMDGNISEESSESYDNDTHIASWIEGSLIGSSIFNKDDDEVNNNDDDNSSTSSHE